MPIVNVKRDDLFAKIGRTYTDEEFDQLCFEFGIENDDIVSESEIKGNDTPTPDAVWYKIDVPANRYDLLCVEGIARAFRIFLNLEENIDLKITTPASPYFIQQDKSTLGIRSFVMGAILRNVDMTQKVYNSFLDLQDKLHFNIGRRRTLVAIGTHDLDKIEGPFKYTALPYDQIKFTPLFESKEYNINELFHYYRNVKENCHLKPYLDIAASMQPGVENPLHPVIVDNRGQVLSLPPVINSDYSKLTLDTKNVFIEITATDFTKANIVLNTLIAMFSEHCANKFEVELVHVEHPEALIFPPNTEADRNPIAGKPNTYVYPTLTERVFETNNKYLNSGIGLKLSNDEICALLQKMQLKATDVDGDKIHVVAPVTRSDVLHPIDIQEDVAIAYGYNNIPRSLPPVVTVGRENPLSKLSDQLRQVVAMCQYTEVMTWALIQTEENFEKIGRKDPGEYAVTLSNSKTDFTSCRTTLLPGLLKVVQANKSFRLPVQIFELGDVVFQDKTHPEGAINQRRLGVLFGSHTSGFEEVHGVLTRLMDQLNIPFRTYSDFEKQEGKPTYYTIRECKEEQSTYLAKRVAEVIISTGEVIGQFGIVHPDVLGQFEIEQHCPCSVLEINIEPFL